MTDVSPSAEPTNFDNVLFFLSAVVSFVYFTEFPRSFGVKIQFLLSMAVQTRSSTFN